MHPRLDPACQEARDLEARHRQQETLLVGGDREGQLANVVLRTHEAQVEQHRRACARCLAFGQYRGCPECGFDTRKTRHGWMCSAAESRWMDIFPWNWRPRFARLGAASPPVRRETPAAPAGASRRVPVDEVLAKPAPRQPAAPVPGGGSVAHRAASNAPKPRPKPATPKADALQLAYQALGVSPSASEDDVRAAYRAKAQQYHPDKVATMAPEFRALAEQKMTELNTAYERIKRAR